MNKPMQERVRKLEEATGEGIQIVATRFGETVEQAMQRLRIEPVKGVAYIGANPTEREL